jgi:hypothetical protein
VGTIWRIQRHGTILTDCPLVTAAVFTFTAGIPGGTSDPDHGFSNRAGFGRGSAVTGRFGSAVDRELDSADTSRIESSLDSDTQ